MENNTTNPGTEHAAEQEATHKTHQEQTTFDKRKENVDEGDAVSLNYDITNLDDRELKSLQEELLALRQDKSELERKRFVDNSLSRFTELMRLKVDSTLDSWADTLLAELVPFVDGLQAALFMIDDANPETPKLKCIGGYAMPKDALRELEIGQGITGQAAKNGKTLYFSSDDNFESHTESSLSKIDAEVLLVQPLIQNDKVEGVLELTSLEGLDTDKREFLEELSDSMAGSLVTLRNQVRIQQLFGEAQQRQEELQAQEEEMRQNVEELQATQEEMKRLQKQAENSEQRIRTMMNNIPMGVVVLLKDLTPFFANTLAEDMLDIDFNLIDRIDNVSQTFSLFLAGSDEPYPEEHLPHNSALEGESKTLSDVEFKKDDRRVPLEITGAPVRNAQGEVTYAIITLADISERKQQETEIRQQNEELGAREEEMRQNLEELEATQEQMKHMQQRAERQKLILDAILDSNEDTIIAVDNNMNILTVNEVVRQQYKASDINIKSGKPIFDYLPEEQHDEYREKFQRALNDERFTEHLEYEHDGATLHYDIDYYPIKSKRGEIIGAASVAQDVSERYEQINMLRDVQRSLTVINEVTPILEFTPDGIIQRVNESAQAVFGYTADELINQHHRMLVPEHTRESEDYAQFWAHLAKGETYTGTFERITKDGDSIFLIGNYSPVYNDDGELERVVKVAVDVTDEVQARKSADQAESQLKHIVTEAPLGVCMYNDEGIFEFVNQRYADIYGYESPQVMIGEHFTIIIPEAQREEWREAMTEAMKAGETFDGVFDVVNVKGEEMKVRVSSAKLEGNDGAMRHFSYVEVLDNEDATTGSLLNGGLPGYLPAAGWAWHLKTDEVVLSDELRELLGHTKKAWKPSKDYLQSIIHADDLPAFNQLADDYLAGKAEKHDQSLRIQTKGSSYGEFRNLGELVTDADGKPETIRGIFMK